MRYKTKLYFSLFIGIIVLLQGCMKEDLSSCGLFLQFTYKDKTDNFLDSIKTVDLFAFDEGGYFVGKWMHSTSSGNQMRLPLEKGNYTLVAWGDISNKFNYTKLVPGVTTFSQALMSLRRDRDYSVRDKLMPIYHGIVYNLSVKKIGRQFYDIDFTNNVNYIEVTMTGLPIKDDSEDSENGVISTSRFSALITSSNGDYKFDNSRWESSPNIKYIPKYKQLSGVLSADFSTLRLAAGDDSRLIVNHAEDDGSIRELYNESLTELIAKNPNVDFDLESHFHIELIFDHTYTVIGITINDWEVVNSDNGSGGVIG